jgi:transcriptional regulator with XRE-family HTH domain
VASNLKTKGAHGNTKSQKIARLKNKRYRDAFVASQISVGLPFQIRALREQRGWKQAHLAEKAGMLQPRISAMESPGGAKFNLETLRRLASAFDVGLAVRFVPFSDLVGWSERFSPDDFKIPSFSEEASELESEVEVGAEQQETSFDAAHIAMLPDLYHDWGQRISNSVAEVPNHLTVPFYQNLPSVGESNSLQRVLNAGSPTPRTIRAEGSPSNFASAEVFRSHQGKLKEASPRRYKVLLHA